MECSRCLMNDNDFDLTFDENGECQYCNLHDELDRKYDLKTGRERLKSICSDIRKDGKGKPYDVIVGVSGGRDSSYMLHLAKEMGLRPLAVHYDNTWNSATASMNIAKVTSAMGVPLETYVVGSYEMDTLYSRFMAAESQDLEAPTDIGFITTLYESAYKHGVKYIWEGHSFRTEGIAPLDWAYMDGKYIESVYGAKLHSFPNLTLWRFIKYCLTGIKRIRPLYYVQYDSQDIKSLLINNYGWTWYGNHHSENRFTSFFINYYRPIKLNRDTRIIEYSALIRSGQIEKEIARNYLNETPPLEIEAEIFDAIERRLSLDIKKILENKYYTTCDNFKNYKKTFKQLKPFFWLMVKLNRVPESFYEKYCK